MITLVPLMMRTPNIAGILSPSRLRSFVTIGRREFLALADEAAVRRVSLHPDGVSDARPTTTYRGCIAYEHIEAEEITNGR